MATLSSARPAQRPRQAARASSALRARAGAPVSRRSQKERRAETQHRLCEAAVELITELGYERLTILQIAKRAGVSKGAQAHHYPTKEDMLVAAFKHLLQQWEDKREAFAQTHGARADMAELMHYMWRDIFGHPQYPAALELMLASHHHPTLRDRMRDALSAWTVARNQTFLKVLPMKDQAQLVLFIEMNFCLLRGMAVYESLANDPSVNRKILEMWIGMASHFVQTQAPQDGAAASSDVHRASRLNSRQPYKRTTP